MDGGGRREEWSSPIFSRPALSFDSISDGTLTGGRLLQTVVKTQEKCDSHSADVGEDARGVEIEGTATTDKEAIGQSKSDFKSNICFTSPDHSG